MRAWGANRTVALMTNPLATDTTFRPARILGRMTVAERAVGRFLRGPDEHPPVAEPEPAAPAATAVPVTPDASLVAPPEPAAPTLTRPDGLPDEFWDDATGVKPEAYARFAELAAADAARREGLPATAEEYTLDLPEEIVGLDGKPVSIDANDPLAKAILPALHKGGVPQSVVSEIVQAYAAQEVADAKADAEAAATFRTEQLTKLGAEHAKRTAALHGQVIAAIGAEPAEAIRAQMRSAEAVIALEALVSKIQGPAFGAAPTTPAEPDALSILYPAQAGR